MDRRVLLGGGIIVAAVAFLGVRMAVNTGAKSGLDDALAHLPPGFTATHGAVSYNALTGSARVGNLAIFKDGAKLFSAADVTVSGIGERDATGTPKRIGSVVLHDAAGGPYQHIDRIDLDGLAPATLRQIIDPAAYPGGKPAWTDKRLVLDHLTMHGVTSAQTTPAPGQPAGAPPVDVKFNVGVLTADGVRLSQLPAPPDFSGNPKMLSLSLQQVLAEDTATLKDMDFIVGGKSPANAHVASAKAGHYDGGRMDSMAIDDMTIRTTVPAGTITVAGMTAHGLDFSRMLAALPAAVADPATPHPEMINGMHLDGAEMHGMRIDYPDGPLITLDAMSGGGNATAGDATSGSFAMRALTVQTSGRPMKPPVRAALDSFGMADFTTDLHETGGYDAAAHRVVLKQCDIDFHALGTLHFSFVVSGIGPGPFTTPQDIEAAMVDARLNAATIRWDDASLTTRLMKMAAAKQGTTPQQVRASLAMPLASLPVLMPQQPDVAQQVNAFLDGRHSLTIALTPAAPVSLAQWDSAPVPARAALLGARVTGN